MATGLAEGTKATKGFIMNHWLAFIVVALILIILALAYDQKNGGKLRATFAGWPIVGKLFMAFAFVWMLHGHTVTHTLLRLSA